MEGQGLSYEHLMTSLYLVQTMLLQSLILLSLGTWPLATRTTANPKASSKLQS